MIFHTKHYLVKNCEDLSLIAFDTIVVDYKLPCALLANVELDHTIAIVGDVESIPKEPRGFHFNRLYGGTKIVCDIWGNIVSYANEFLKLYEEKMKKWDTQGKRIYGNSWDLASDEIESLNESWYNYSGMLDYKTYERFNSKKAISSSPYT